MVKKKHTQKSSAKKTAAKKAPTPEKKPAQKKAATNPRIEALEDIKLRGLFLHGYAITMDAAPVVFDTEEFRSLVDQFYEENRDLVTPVIHRACRENYEFFMTMVEKALNHFNERNE
ncbi:MAG: hypothetical protein A4E73_02240 [Syntrophaceae bacterium PtaU1.Bin231]|nr:MAG: hypothetical protein A4E73_02240 [Syntrophaceae bacterium PtaU1.Bin231]